MNKLDIAKRVQILAMLVEGSDERTFYAQRSLKVLTGIIAIGAAIFIHRRARKIVFEYLAPGQGQISN